MKSGSAAYWLPITVSSIADRPDLYEGYGARSHPNVDEWLTEALDLFTEIYGSVVDAHYIVSNVSFTKEKKYKFTAEIVVIGFMDSEQHFNELVHDHWPQDLAEQLNQAASIVEFNGIVSYDYNTVTTEPVWTKYNA